MDDLEALRAEIEKLRGELKKQKEENERLEKERKESEERVARLEEANRQASRHYRERMMRGDFLPDEGGTPLPGSTQLNSPIRARRRDASEEWVAETFGPIFAAPGLSRLLLSFQITTPDGRTVRTPGIEDIDGLIDFLNRNIEDWQEGIEMQLDSYLGYKER